MRKRYNHNLSHYHLTTMDMGYLVPVACIPVLAGDSFKHSTALMIRLQPMLAPIMHNIRVRIHHWYVPNRLLWTEWTDFITGGDQGYGIVPPHFPYIEVSEVKKGSLFDYFRLPALSESDNTTLKISALPFRAYAMIWNEFYRDQDLQDDLLVSFESGKDDVTNTTLQKVSWAKDYFTTARPWTQKGTEITVPISPASAGSQITKYTGKTFTATTQTITITPTSMSIIDVKYVNFAYWTFTGSAVTVSVAVYDSNDDFYQEVVTIPITGVTDLPDSVNAYVSNIDKVYYTSYIGNNYSLEITFTPSNVAPIIPTGSKLVGTVGTFDIADLRYASALQRFEEARAKYGSRYIEYLAHLGIRSSDARLQLPEYLGGGKQLIQTSQVLQMAEGTEPVGTMRGHGLGLLSSNKYGRFFEEHGYVLSLVSILPSTMYTQGLERHWRKFLMTDYYVPELASIGMQELYNYELYVKGEDMSATDYVPEVFGYQDRYQEYRSIQSGVSGDFRDTLDFWHLARQFGNKPALNSSFIQSNPSKRIFAEQTQHEFLVLANHRLKARRMVPKVAKTLLK